jgi:hypothetical protein
MKHPSPLILAPLLVLCACATQAPTRTAFLGPATQMERATDTIRAQIDRRREADAVKEITAIRIEPTALSPSIIKAASVSEAEANAVLFEIERQLCYDLSRRFRIADMTDETATRIQSQLTRIQSTNAASAVMSSAISRAIPGPASVRLPIGRGGMSVEARAETPTGREAAAMSWSRGAGIANDGGSISEVGDAHRFADAFAADFTRWLAGEEVAAIPVPEPDPCARYGQRLNLGKEALSRITGLYSVPAGGTTPPEPSKP